MKCYLWHIIIDEDMAGDYLLAEAKFPLNQVLPQMQKKFQICLEKPDLRVSLILYHIPSSPSSLLLSYLVLLLSRRKLNLNESIVIIIRVLSMDFYQDLNKLEELKFHSGSMPNRDC